MLKFIQNKIAPLFKNDKRTISRAREIEKTAVYAVTEPSRFRHVNQDYQTSRLTGVESYATLRNMARYYDKNNPTVISIFDSFVNNIVGHKGIIIEPNPLNDDGTTNEELKRLIKKKWAIFLRSATAQNYKFSQVQRDICRAWLRDGDVFVQHIDGIYKKRKVPYMMQIINAELVPDLNDADGSVLGGIKFDEAGAILGFYVQPPNSDNLLGGSVTKYFSADKMFMIANKQTLAQPRGITKIHGIMIDNQDLDDYEDSEKIKAKMQASLVLAISKEMGGPSNIIGMAEKEEPQEHVRMGAGMIVANLKPGESVTPIESNAPSPFISDYAQHIARKIAAGSGASVSTITRNYNGTYSAQRQELLEAWQGYKLMQNEFSCQFLMPVFDRFIENLIKDNVINPGMLVGVDMDHITNAEYVYPVMPWIDPAKEQKAQETAINNGTTSRSRVIRENGEDPDEIFKEIKEDNSTGLFNDKLTNEVIIENNEDL